ncbi:hypothetical protein [Nocardia acidivorans]|uniref:hypothetical protein n=1 Tax=Nocardia acidivorans TaxID=404580 RepID=UPI00082F7BCD|nr:hypothetical protein [Nocardia acidivorans]
MDSVVALALAISPIVLFAAAFELIVHRARRRGIGGSVVGPFQEMWDPGSLRAQLTVETQAEEAAPNPSPDDGLDPVITLRRADRGGVES